MESIWMVWSDMPAVSVVIKKNLCDLDTISIGSVRKELIKGLEHAFTLGCNRAFIFFSEFQSRWVQKLLTDFRSEVNDFELNVELIVTEKNKDRYEYLGLQEAYEGNSTQKFIILSLAPSRKKQALRLSLYSEKVE